MDEGGAVLAEILKAKENIKRKYNALKSEQADVQSSISKVFKPIIQPLNKLSEIQQNNSDVSRYPSPTLTNDPVKIEKDSTIDIDNNINQKDKINLPINDWFKISDLDKTYGPKKLVGDKITLGDKEIKFENSDLIIEETSYRLTPGLSRLIFFKNPIPYTEHDLEVYKSILLQTSAHLTLDGSKVKKSSGIKYVNVIETLFPSGSGLFKKLRTNNLVYWNDPNELVDRLRLLLASQQAGNNSVHNEIISIFEELYEAGIIKRIPNV